MKKLIFSLLFSFCFILVKGIGAEIVNDPILATFAAEEAEARIENRVTIIKQLQESIYQTDELRKSYEFIKKGYDLLTDVNSLLTNLSSLERSIKRQTELYKAINKSVNELAASTLFSLEEYQKFNGQLSDFIINGQRIIEMLTIVIQPGKAKMNDSERMQNMIKLEDKLNENCLVTKETIQYYYSIRDQREMYQAFNNIQKKFK